MPVWQREIAALYEASSTLRRCVSLEDCRKLFQKCGGVPGQTFASYERGCLALTEAIKRCESEACIKFWKLDFFCRIKHLGQHDRLEVRSHLMHFEVVADGTYENAVVNSGSHYIRDALVSATGKSSA
jgi:hypothetical protein